MNTAARNSATRDPVGPVVRLFLTKLAAIVVVRFCNLLCPAGLSHPLVSSNATGRSRADILKYLIAAISIMRAVQNALFSPPSHVYVARIL